MSNTTSPSNPRLPRTGVELSRRFRRATADGVRAVAFWAAVLLPLAYLPAFSTTGSQGFFALFTLHVACVVVGHEHNHPSEDH